MQSIKFLAVDLGLVVASALVAVHEQGAPSAQRQAFNGCPTFCDSAEQVVLMMHSDDVPSMAEVNRVIAGLNMPQDTRITVRGGEGAYVIIFTMANAPGP